MSDIHVHTTPIKKIEKKIIIDKRTFEPHQIKEVDIWSWKKMKNEKWFVQIDYDTGKFNMWKGMTSK